MNGKSASLTGIGVSAVIAFAVAAGTVAVASHGAAPAACVSTAPKLTVEGSGMTTGTPDTLTLALTVTVTKPSAASALQVVSNDTSKVNSALESSGVQPSDIQTTNLTIYPSYTYPPQGSRLLSGYTATNSLSAVVHKLASAGATIDAVSAAGGNDVQIGSLTFSFGNPSGLDASARAAAVTQAKSEAIAMATSGGVQLGALCSVTDGTTSPPTPYTFNYAAEGATPLSSTALPVSPGTQKISANVTLVYAIHPR